MCGLVGILGHGDVARSVLAALKSLEYRGYDSAGISTLQGGLIDCRRAAGKLSNLVELLKESPLLGASGIGHTRWATHGAATPANAHPHTTRKVSVVNNGIIENYLELRDELEAEGYRFSSQTDSEVCPQLITYYMEREGLSPLDAVQRALERIVGNFAIVAIFAREDDLMIGACKGSPLAVSMNPESVIFASDALAISLFADNAMFLEESDLAVANRAGIQITDKAGACVERERVSLSGVANDMGRNGYSHFMAKEIFEQPEAARRVLSQYVDPENGRVVLPEESEGFCETDRLLISGCGTAYHAGLIARYWFEQLARIQVEIDIASELRYRDVVYPERGSALFISQSGETADTLAALREARRRHQRIGAIVNMPQSTIAREADVLFPMNAGPEIGVASTKAFVCQLLTLLCIAVAMGKRRGVIGSTEEIRIVGQLLKIPRLLSEALHQGDSLEALGMEVANADAAIFIGRGVSYPLALEGALKLKELTYMHASGYAAGELKHGPIALVDDSLPIIAIAPQDKHFKKTMSNLNEVSARGGKVLLLADHTGIAKANINQWAECTLPDTDPLMSPIVYAAPLQLLAYHAALARQCNVDQPRNLAKSVTVE